MKATAKAHPNIALVKYWGKRDKQLNLPAVGSISVTLNEIFTVSTVCFKENFTEDTLILNDKKAAVLQTERVSRFLDIIRKKAGIRHKAEIKSRNNFPTGAGLASSASAFASLALAGSRAAGLNLQLAELSELARRGSGSAARSVFGGFVEMQMGIKPDGSDSIAVQLTEKNYWDIRILIAVTSEKEKTTGSTAGMMHTAETSPFYKQWLAAASLDLKEMRDAVLTRNFSKLGEISEYSCLKMHATALSAKPGLIYWNAATLSAMHTIRNLREQGLPVYFTIDAGPQVKAICQSNDVNIVHSELEKIEGVKRIIETSLGPGAKLIEESF